MAERIAAHSDIHFGKPCVAGTRITVQSVLELVREGVAPADICRDYYPDLRPEDVQACVQYAIDLIALTTDNHAHGPDNLDPRAVSAASLSRAG